MRALKRRIRRLEEKLAPEPVSRGPSPADILRERRRRRLQAEGLAFEEPTPIQFTSGTGRRLSVAEILRQRRDNRLRSNSGHAASAARAPFR